MKSKKRVTATGLGLGLPSITGGRKPTRVWDDNDAHSFDLVGRPCLPKRSSSSLLAPEARPGPRPLQFTPAPQLWPIDLVEPPDHVLSPLELIDLRSLSTLNTLNLHSTAVQCGLGLFVVKPSATADFYGKQRVSKMYTGLGDNSGNWNAGRGSLPYTH